MATSGFSIPLNAEERYSASGEGSTRGGAMDADLEKAADFQYIVPSIECSCCRYTEDGGDVCVGLMDGSIKVSIKERET